MAARWDEQGPDRMIAHFNCQESIKGDLRGVILVDGPMADHPGGDDRGLGAHRCMQCSSERLRIRAAGSFPQTPSADWVRHARD